jgi:hypothetical protein
LYLEQTISLKKEKKSGDIYLFSQGKKKEKKD